MNEEVIRLVQDGKLTELRQLFGTAEQMCKWKFSKTGDTLAILACRFGNVELLRELTSFDAGASISANDAKWDAPNYEAKRPIHEAAQQCREECVQLLLSTGKVNVNALKRAEWTPLHLACTRANSAAVCRLLLDAGASTSMRNKDGWNALHIASRDSTLDVLKLLIERDPHCAATKSRNGRTPLHTCALNGCEENLLFLLELFASGSVRPAQPADSDSSEPAGSTDPEQSCAHEGKCLAEINALDSCGSTPLADAVRGDHLRIAELLVRWGASLTARDNLGRSLLHIAAETGSLNTIDWLLEKTVIAESDRTQTQEALCPFGVNDRCGDPLGMTPLHFAARENHREVLQLLLKHGGDMNACDKKGRTVFEYLRHPL